MSISSDASSSISVVSVPFEVTGEGPTISLGLIICIEFDDILLTELGRRRDESVAGGGEELCRGLARPRNTAGVESRTDDGKVSGDAHYLLFPTCFPGLRRENVDFRWMIARGLPEPWLEPVRLTW